MEAKHTPGPWHVVFHPDKLRYDIHSQPSHPNDAGSRVLSIKHYSVEQAVSNAQVAATAPELLDALCAVLRSYEAACPERYYSDDNVALADDVIKKAIG